MFYNELTINLEEDRGPDFATLLLEYIRRLNPKKLIMTRYGDYHVFRRIKDIAHENSIELDLQEHNSFYQSPKEFNGWIETHPHPMLEFYYRHLRQDYLILIQNGKPSGGTWDYDKSNRQPFPSLSIAA